HKAMIDVARVSVVPDDNAAVTYDVAKCVAGIAPQGVERLDLARRFAEESVGDAGTGVEIKSDHRAPVVHPVGPCLAERTIHVERRDRSAGCAHVSVIVVAAVYVRAG